MERLTTDVVVMGTGGAGMCAAVAAQELGARVVVFEKRKVPGGISVTGMGIFAAESHLQRERNIPFTRDQAFKHFMALTQWHADARLVRAYIDKTATTIDWLEKQGVEFELLDAYTYPECFTPTGHLVKRPGEHPFEAGRTFVLVKTLLDRARERGVDIRMGTPVKKIIKTGDRITGVVAEAPSGEIIEVETKAVIVAGGGYGTNAKMVKEHGGFELGRTINMLTPIELAGDAIQMAWDVGADPEIQGMRPQVIYGMPRGNLRDDESRIVTVAPYEMYLPNAAMQPHLWVNPEGKRFWDESTCGNAAYTGNALARQKDGYGFCLFDKNIRSSMEQELDHISYLQRGLTKLTDLDKYVQAAIDDKSPNTFRADSIAELASAIGADAAALQKTVDEYNACCAKGHDDLFAKDRKYMRPLTTPPFYALRVMTLAYGTVGGIRINEHTEVLTEERKVIPGLYAAGDCANAIHSYNYSLVYSLWGSTLGFACNSGRMAGENAARYVKSFT